MNNLRRLAAAILALMMLFALTATAFAESKTAENKAPVSKAPYEELAYLNGQLRVGMECAYAPNNWQEAEASDTNVPIENVPGSFAEGYDVEVSLQHLLGAVDARLAVHFLGKRAGHQKISEVHDQGRDHHLQITGTRRDHRDSRVLTGRGQHRHGHDSSLQGCNTRIFHSNAKGERHSEVPHGNGDPISQTF